MSLLMRQFGRPGAQRACIPQACSSLKGLDGAGRSNSTGCASPGADAAAAPGRKARSDSAARRGGEKAKRFRCERQRGANEGAKRQRQPLNFTGFAAAIGPHGGRRRGALISAAICRGQSSFGSAGGNPNALARS